jgi:ADP-dependent NAD(P)H-hydrate dehydratase
MTMPTTPETVTAELLRRWPLPAPGDSKRGRGRVLVVGGARSTPGAAMLAAVAALRVGAGVLSMGVAASVAAAVAVAVPESSVQSLPEDEDGVIAADAAERLAPRLAEYEAVLVGPGLDDPERTRDLLDAVLPRVGTDTRVVLDAFALGVLPQVRGLDKLDGRLSLTPNRSEAARLLEVGPDELDRVGDDVEVAAAIARRYGACVAYQSCVHDGDAGWLVPFGHAGLGTSGSGDVLAGVAAGLLARGTDRTHAMCWASYLHAAAGDRLAPAVGRIGFLARELVDTLPRVLTELEV